MSNHYTVTLILGDGRFERLHCIASSVFVWTVKTTTFLWEPGLVQTAGEM